MTRTRLFAVLVALATAVFMTACSNSSDTATDNGHADHAQTEETITVTGEPAGFNSADIAFATNMIPHHEQALELSALVPERSTDPELLALADQIAGAQDSEIATMTAMLDEWGAPVEMEHHGDMSMGGMATEDQIAALEAARGAEFDRLFVELMIAHHLGGI